MKTQELLITNQYCTELLYKNSIVHPLLKCASNKPIYWTCIHPSCNQDCSIFCADPQCQTCKNKHQTCHSSKLKSFTEFLTAREDGHKDFMRKMFQIQKKLIDSIIQSRKELIKKFSLGDLEQNYLDLIQKIYFQHNNQQEIGQIKGKDFLDLDERLRRDRRASVQNQALLLDSFKSQTQQAIQNFKLLKQRVLQSFVNAKQHKKDEIFMTPQCLANYQNKSILAKHYKTLNLQFTLEQTTFIKNCLNNPKKIERIFRASQHDFKAAQFHKYCDNIEHTLVIVRTEFGKTIGGYTPLKWNAMTDGNYVPDLHKDSFLFSVDLQELYRLKVQANAVFSHSQSGPIFGAGNDLAIYDSCNANARSHCKGFPTSYDGIQKYKKNQKAHTAFCGAPSGFSFMILEYQVFRVTF